MENLIGKQFYANMQDGIVLSKGKIYFEENGLVFKASSIPFNTLKIQYKDLVSIKEQNTLGIIPNGVGVSFGNGQKRVFAVNNRRSVIEFLNSMMSRK